MPTGHGLPAARRAARSSFAWRLRWLVLRPVIAFQLESFLMRGPHYKVLALWAVVLAIALIGGGLAYLAPAAQFGSFLDAAWWAFLRLSDPGFLAEDAGPGLRLLAIVLTVLGLAVFVGALVAVLTQSFNEHMDRLALGLTPVTCENHVVILGWTSRTVELLGALSEEGRPSTRVVALIERVTPERWQQISDRLPNRAFRRSLVLRSGDAEQVEHLERANCRGASVIVLPGADQPPQGAASRDPRTLKILASLDRHTADLEGGRPRVAAEVFDSSLLAVAEATYGGRSQIVLSDTLVGRSLALGVLSPGLSGLFVDLLDTRRGCAVRVAQVSQLAGNTIIEATSRFSRAVIFGAFRRNLGTSREALESVPTTRLDEEDRLLVLAPVDDPLELGPPLPDALRSRPPPLLGTSPETVRRVLVLGWNSRAPHMLWELARQELRWRVDVLALTEPAVVDRPTSTQGRGETLELRSHVGDPTVPTALAKLPLSDYDTIVLLASGAVSDVEAADSRTIASVLVLEHLLETAACHPHVIAELLDPANAPVLAQRRVELVQTARLVAQALAGAVERPEIGEILARLLRGDFGRPGILPLPLITGVGETLEVGRLEVELRHRGRLMLGLQRAASRFALELLPDKRQTLRVRRDDRLVVITPVEAAPRSKPGKSQKG